MTFPLRSGCTTLISGEERTREVFGGYVSVYNFRQSVEDGATVRLFYENRTPGWMTIRRRSCAKCWASAIT